MQTNKHNSPARHQETIRNSRISLVDDLLRDALEGTANKLGNRLIHIAEAEMVPEYTDRLRSLFFRLEALTERLRGFSPDGLARAQFDCRTFAEEARLFLEWVPGNSEPMEALLAQIHSLFVEAAEISNEICNEHTECSFFKINAPALPNCLRKAQGGKREGIEFSRAIRSNAEHIIHAVNALRTAPNQTEPILRSLEIGALQMRLVADSCDITKEAYSTEEEINARETQIDEMKQRVASLGHESDEIMADLAKGAKC